MLIISIIVLPLSGSVRRGTKAALCDQLFELSSSHCYLGLASLAAHLNGSDSIDWNHVPLGRTVVSYDQLLWMKKICVQFQFQQGFPYKKSCSVCVKLNARYLYLLLVKGCSCYWLPFLSPWQARTSYRSPGKNQLQWSQALVTYATSCNNVLNEFIDYPP